MVLKNHELSAQKCNLGDHWRRKNLEDPLKRSFNDTDQLCRKHWCARSWETGRKGRTCLPQRLPGEAPWKVKVVIVNKCWLPNSNFRSTHVKKILKPLNEYWNSSFYARFHLVEMAIWLELDSIGWIFTPIVGFKCLILPDNLHWTHHII